MWTLVTIPIIAVVLLRTYKLVENDREARKLGIPILVAPVSWQDPLWLLVRPYMEWVDRLPFHLGDFVRVTYLRWPAVHGRTMQQLLGDHFVIVSPGINEIVITDPSAAVELLTRYKIWVKPDAVFKVFDTFGKNVTTTNGDEWQRHRKIIGPAFREQNCKLVWDESLRQTRQMLDTYRGQKQRTIEEVGKDTERIAMNVLSAAAFGKTDNFRGDTHRVEQGHRLTYVQVMDILLPNVFTTILFSSVNVPSWIPLPGQLGRVRAAVREFRQYLQEMIEQQKANSVQREIKSANLISALVKANKLMTSEDKSSSTQSMTLTADELYGNLYMFNIAGFDTTASTLMYAVGHLAINQDVQDWVRQEVDQVFVIDTKKEYGEGFPEMKRCLAVMYETLRIHSLANHHVRHGINQPHTLQLKEKALHVPPGVYVSVNVYGVHHDLRMWGGDALDWHPQRWIRVDDGTGKECLADPPPGAGYIGWSLGPRVCPGKKFSQVEFVAVVAGLLQNYSVKPMRMQKETAEQALARLVKVMKHSMVVMTPKLQRPRDAGVVFDQR